MKFVFAVFVIFVLVLFKPSLTLAATDPNTRPNNIFGIHIIDENDLPDAVSLVNGGGGEWGYVTLVITQGDRNREKWQSIFDKMRRLKVIPIIRLATKFEGESWARPKVEDAESWVEFLNSLNWVVKNRYVILFNEPNHAKEWGGKIEPEEYAVISKEFVSKLKQSSHDYFVLPAGFDSSAPNSSVTMNSSTYWDRMAKKDKNIFSLFDGWTSHSYPNPGFSSSVSKVGKGSIKSFDWEVSYLGKYGLSKNTPIFITETGWVKDSKFTETQIADNFENAYKNVWDDPRVVAVTPFILSYIDKPFDIFSWKKNDGKGFFEYYERIKSYPKIKGRPEQVSDASLVRESFPTSLITDSEYRLPVKIKNLGQSIWEGDYSLKITSESVSGKIFASGVPVTEPMRDAEVEVYLKTPKEIGDLELELQMTKGGIPFGEKSKVKVTLIPPPSIVFTPHRLPKRSSDGPDYELYLYDGNKEIAKYTNIKVEEGKGIVGEVRNIVPMRKYKFGLRRPGRTMAFNEEVLTANTTSLKFGPLLPIDFNNDTKFTLGDILIFPKLMFHERAK